MKLSYSIDPGLSGTGWAEWKGRELTRVGVLHYASDRETLVEKCESLGHQLEEEISVAAEFTGTFKRHIRVYIEMPQMMTNVRGLAAQAGAVYKLAFLVGYLARAVQPCQVEEVPVSAWKGQLPKDVVRRRIEKTLGKEACTHLGIKTHAWDAVGLGLWATGIWKGKS